MSNRAPSEGAPGGERRKHKRVPLNLLVQYRFDSLEEFLVEHAIDLSEGGVFVRTDDPAAVGSKIFVQFSLKDGTQLIRGAGRVVRVIPKSDGNDAGMAIELTSFDDESRAMVRAIVDQFIAEAHTRS